MGIADSDRVDRTTKMIRTPPEFEIYDYACYDSFSTKING
jgi:hypothetical protein